MLEEHDTTVSDDIITLIESTDTLIKTALKHGNSLDGNNYYAKKFIEKKVKSSLIMRNLQTNLDLADDEIKNSLNSLNEQLEIYFNPQGKTDVKRIASKNIFTIYKTNIEPNLGKEKKHIPTDNLFPRELIEKTKPYIERIAEQALGSYDFGWYDASAVMIRRLLETLIIECFEKKTVPEKIKNIDGNFLYLDGLINKLLDEDPKLWSLSRNTKSALPKLKKIGDQSAHSRFFTARQPDIDNLKTDLRIVIEELIHISEIESQ